jgi:hypothetical protein
MSVQFRLFLWIRATYFIQRHQNGGTQDNNTTKLRAPARLLRLLTTGQQKATGGESVPVAWVQKSRERVLRLSSLAGDRRSTAGKRQNHR